MTEKIRKFREACITSRRILDFLIKEPFTQTVTAYPRDASVAARRRLWYNRVHPKAMNL